MNRYLVVAVLRATARRLMAAPLRLDGLVPKLQKELRQMTKLYKSLVLDSTPEAVERFLSVERLFKTYSDNLDDVVFEQILGQMPAKERIDERGGNDGRSWESKKLHEAAWNFLLKIRPSALFPTQYNYEKGARGLSMKDTYDPAPWALKGKIDTKIRAYQRYAVVFFKVLQEFIDNETRRGAPLEREDATETTSFAGLNIVLHNKGRTGGDFGIDDKDIAQEDEYAKRQLKSFFSYLHDSVAMIKRAGFGAALTGLTLHVGFVAPKSRFGEAAGSYDEWRDELWIHRLNFFDEKDPGHTFVHEVGHRFYYKKLPPRVIKHWDSVIKSRLAEVTPEGITAWVNFIAPSITTRPKRRFSS